MPAAYIQLHNYDLFESNRVLNPPAIVSPPPPVLNFFNPSIPQSFYSPLQLEMAASAFFTHGYFQQAHVHTFEAIITG